MYKYPSSLLSRVYVYVNVYGVCMYMCIMCICVFEEIISHFVCSSLDKVVLVSDLGHRTIKNSPNVLTY